MDVKFINDVLTTYSIKFKANLEGAPYLFYVRAGDSAIDPDGRLVITDCIENKTFTLPSNTIILEACGRDDIFTNISKDISSKSKKTLKKIQRNNSLYDVEFEEIKLLALDIDNTSESLQILKDIKPTEVLVAMKKLGITDLASYYAGGERAARVLRERSLELLKITAAEAKTNLNEEREKFIQENDIDSVEEIDIILEMIDTEVGSTTFDTVSCVEDIYLQWPPILLPVPFER